METKQNNISNPEPGPHFLDDQETLLTTLNDEAAKNLLPLIVTLVVLMVVGIIGNSLVLYVYLRKMHGSAKRTFILALAWMDMSVCVIVIPSEIYDLRNQFMFTNEGLCKGMRFLEYATVVSAGFVLVSVSFERYYFLCKAFQTFSVRKAKIVCLGCVFFATVVATPSVVFAGAKTRHFPDRDTNVTGHECSLNSEESGSELFKRLFHYASVGIFVVCVITFIVLYSMIGSLLWKYHSGRFDPANIDSAYVISSNYSNISTTSANSTFYTDSTVCGTGAHQSSLTTSNTSVSSSRRSQSGTHGKRSIKSAGTVIIFFSVTVVFVLSFLPHLTMRIIMAFRVHFNFDKDTNELLYNFFIRSYLLSNVSNPFIYSILNPAFRRELKQTFKRLHFCRKRY